MIKTLTGFCFGMGLAFLIAGYHSRAAFDDLGKQAYGLGVKDMAEICKSATDKLAELEKK